MGTGKQLNSSGKSMPKKAAYAASVAFSKDSSIFSSGQAEETGMAGGSQGDEG